MNGVESVELFEAIITILLASSTTYTSSQNPPPATDIAPIAAAIDNADCTEASPITTTVNSQSNDSNTTLYTTLKLHDKVTWLHCLTKLNRFTLLNGFLSPIIRTQLLTWLEYECAVSECVRSGEGSGGVSMWTDIIRECIEKYSVK